MLIFICDDDRQEMNRIQEYLEKAALDLSSDIKIVPYFSGEALLKAVEGGAKPDLAVFDIFMDGMNGIEAAHRLRVLLPDVFLAFLTSSRDFAVDAFEMDALHYMVKPVTADMFHTLLTWLPARLMLDSAEG